MTPDQTLMAFFAAVILGMVAGGLIGDWWDARPKRNRFMDAWTNAGRAPGQLEQGRRLASERDDLIASGVDPAELVVPLAPLPDVDDAGRWRR